MTERITILNQTALPAGAEQALYTVERSNTARITGFAACNRVAVDRSFRFSVSLDGLATAVEDYLYYDLPLSANDTFLATFEMTLPAGAVVRAYSTLGDITLTLFGQGT